MAETATSVPPDPVELARRQWAGRHPEASGFTVVVSMLRTYALMLRDRFYKRPISSNLKYVTLGVLFVNVSIGGESTIVGIR